MKKTNITTAFNFFLLINEKCQVIVIPFLTHLRTLFQCWSNFGYIFDFTKMSHVQKKLSCLIDTEESMCPWHRRIKQFFCNFQRTFVQLQSHKICASLLCHDSSSFGPKIHGLRIIFVEVKDISQQFSLFKKNAILTPRCHWQRWAGNQSRFCHTRESEQVFLQPLHCKCLHEGNSMSKK